MEKALEAGAEDFVREDDEFMITTAPSDLHAVSPGALEGRVSRRRPPEFAWIPKSSVRVEGANAEALLKLIEALEELDDVQKVDANFDMDESAMAQT